VVQQQSYAKAPQFSCVGTNGAGNLAVGSDKGEIRMFSDCDKRAKTALPGLGDPIVGMDVTEDGKWIVATTKQYLMVIGTEKADGKTGFEGRGMGKEKRAPIKLQLRPEDIVKHNITETSFTTAHFNTGENIHEEWIVTSTGPFIITWDFRKVKQGRVNEYKIKECKDDVVADQFLFDERNKVVVTTDNDIYVASSKKK